MEKKKLSIEEQIADLQTKGVTFEEYSIESAKIFLKHNNYYFKLKHYARNYVINPRTQKYIHLDFAYLVELSKLDMYIRKMIIDMTLDIEHFLKTKMMSDLCDNDEEDGYSIVRDYLKEYPDALRSINQKADSYSISSDLVDKHKDKDDYALWNIVEVLSFGRFVELYTMYYQKNNTHNYIDYLGSIKFLRNAAAHNNCLLSSLMKPNGAKKFRKTKKLSNALSAIKKIGATARDKRMDNPIIHDFVALLFVYNDLLKTGPTRKMRDEKMQNLYEFFNSKDGRLLEKKQYFENNQVITSVYDFISTIIDYIMKQNHNPKHVNYL